MNRNPCPYFAIRLLCLFVVILALGTPASAEWKEKVLYSFQGGSDGATPAGGVVFDKEGNLYGATGDGGSSCPSPGCGTVFQLAPPTTNGDPWTETVLYGFHGNDGSRPTGGVILDQQGNLYGVTAYGGTGTCLLLGYNVGCGLVYELSPPAQKGGAWTETVLYSFQNASDGQEPNGNLVFDNAGNLYGATTFGGGKGTSCDPFYQYCGMVFKLSPPNHKSGKWTEQKLHSFAGVVNGQQSGDGANPNGGLVLDSKGAVYGTTYYGGNNQKGSCQGGSWGTGCGMVFKLTPPKRAGGRWTEKVVHQFNGRDGSNSAAGVVLDANGNLYGTTYFGPPHGYGLIFELKKPSGKVHSWTEMVLHPFSGGNDGANPAASLVFDNHGGLYGTASVDGGGAQYGTVLQLLRKGQAWAANVLYAFPGAPNGRIPTTSLIFDEDGSLYGTTTEGGNGACSYFGCGTVFEVSP